MDEDKLRIFTLASQGFCCSQILLNLVLEDEGSENVDIIRSFNGFCGGLGFPQRTCGILSAGIGVLGLYAGKGSSTDYSNEKLSEIIKEYVKWFDEKYGSTDCLDIVGYKVLEGENGGYPVKCGDIILENYEKLQQILVENDFDYGVREDE